MNRVRISKFLSLVLRHRPEEIGISLDRGGWADVDALIENARKHGMDLSRGTIREVMQQSDKRRFELSDDETRIRATYGHSVSVDLDLEPVQPPPVLYHGTAERTVPSIVSEGLKSQNRNFVHLSETKDEARHVGHRHGRPSILTVDAGRMYEEDWCFYRAGDRIWLTSFVPPEYLEHS